MIKRRLTWLAGTIVLIGIFAGLHHYPMHVLIYPKLPFIQLYKWALFTLILCLFLCLYRILRGPTPADRVVSIDILGVIIVGFCGILGVPTGRSWYIDIGLAWALQSFISTLALAKYLEGKSFDE